MNVLEAIRLRRSVRDFRAEAPPLGDVLRLIDAARLAPSGHNKQPWWFIIVSRKEMLRALGELVQPCIAQAPYCIAVVVDPTRTRWAREDGSAAIENLMLAAVELGLGTVWIQGSLEPVEAEVKGLLRVPESLKVLALIPVGFPEQVPRAKEKRPLSEVAYLNEFGTPIPGWA